MSTVKYILSEAYLQFWRHKQTKKDWNVSYLLKGCDYVNSNSSNRVWFRAVSLQGWTHAGAAGQC